MTDVSDEPQPDQPGPAQPAASFVSDNDAADFVASRFGSGATDVERIGQGEWSRAYAFRVAGCDYVIRFGAHADDFARDRLAAGLASPELPIPRVIELGRAFGGHYAVAERAYGEYIDDLSGPRMRAVMPSLFATLDAARLVDLVGTTGYGGWDESGAGQHATWPAALLDAAEDSPHSRIHGWRARLESSPTGIAPFERGLACLRSLLDDVPADRHLVHSDLLNRNVLVAGDRISAVLDWGCSLYGDFLYDVAWLTFWAPWYPAWADIDFAAEARRHYAAIGLDVPAFGERLRCYEIHIGLGAQAYSAFTGRHADVEWEAARMLRATQRTTTGR